MTTTETNVQPGAMIRATSLPSSNKTLKINDILLVCRAHEEKVDANDQPKLMLAVVGDVKTALVERENLYKGLEVAEYDYDFVCYSQKYISMYFEVVKEEPAAASAEPAEQHSVYRHTRSSSQKKPESVEAGVAETGVEPAGAPAIVEVEPAKLPEGEVESELVVALRAALGAGGAFAAPAIAALGLSAKELDCVDFDDIEAELGYKLSKSKRNVLLKAGVGASPLPSEGSAAAPALGFGSTQNRSLLMRSSSSECITVS